MEERKILNIVINIMLKIYLNYNLDKQNHQDYYYSLGISKEQSDQPHRHRSNSDKYTNPDSFVFNNSQIRTNTSHFKENEDTPCINFGIMNKDNLKSNIIEERKNTREKDYSKERPDRFENLLIFEMSPRHNLDEKDIVIEENDEGDHINMLDKVISDDEVDM